jgi:hypothetical protein
MLVSLRQPPVVGQMKRCDRVRPDSRNARPRGGGHSIHTAASVHLADVTGDGVADLIQCEEHGMDGSDTPGQSVWKAHPWRHAGMLTKCGEEKYYVIAASLAATDISRYRKGIQ